MFWYLFLSSNGKAAALLVVFYLPSTTDQLHTVSYVFWFFLLLFFSPGLLNFISTNHPSKLFPSRQADQHSAALVRQEGITVLSHFSPSARRHHYAVPNSNRARDTDGPGGVSLPKNISG